jgi:hypothetical protein
MKGLFAGAGSQLARRASPGSAREIQTSKPPSAS